MDPGVRRDDIAWVGTSRVTSNSRFSFQTATSIRARDFLFAQRLREVSF
jgi:hypothetical protein